MDNETKNAAADDAQMSALGEIKTEVAELKDLFYRRLMNDKQKAELIQTLTAAAQNAVIEPFLNDIFLLLDRLDGKEDEFSVSVREELFEIVYRRGVERIEPTGEFSPERHRAVKTVEAEGVAVKTITAVMRNGYTFNGRVVRPADVAVAKPMGVITDKGEVC